jgi:hypothetical protein
MEGEITRMRKVTKMIAMAIIFTMAVTPIAEAGIGQGATVGSNTGIGSGAAPSNNAPRVDQRQPQGSNMGYGHGPAVRPNNNRPNNNNNPGIGGGARPNNNPGIGQGAQPNNGGRNTGYGNNNNPGIGNGARPNNNNNWNNNNNGYNPRHHRHHNNNNDDNYGPNTGYNPRPWRHHDDNDSGMSTGAKVAIGVGLAALLGAIISNNSKKSSAASTSRSAIQQEAQAEANRMAKYISANGINKGINKVVNVWREKGATVKTYNEAPVTTVLVTGSSAGTKIEYIVNRDGGTITVRVTANNSIQEEYTEDFKVAVYPTSNYLGFTLGQKRNKYNFPIINEVTRDTVAYRAGMRPGDVLIDVCGTEMRGLSNSQIGQIVADNANDAPTGTVTFSHKGARKTIRVNL